jgi:hypothetical protein
MAEHRLILAAVVALLVSGVLEAQASRSAPPRAPAHRPLAWPAPAINPRAEVAAPAGRQRVTPTMSPAVGSLTMAGNSRLGSPGRGAGAFRSAARRAPANATLGGPSTFDARRLVRR